MCAYFLKRRIEILVIFFLIATVKSAFAQEEKFAVFEVRKKLQLANSEPVMKDYYIVGGYSSGLKPDMIVDVKRNIPIHDGFKNQSRGNLVVTIGKVKIIHVDSDLSVARIFSETTVDNRPITDFETIMIGDYLDIKTASVLVPKTKRSTASETSKNKDEEKVKSSSSSAPHPAEKVLPTHAFMGPELEQAGPEVPLKVN